jgi:hypothetical protein
VRSPTAALAVALTLTVAGRLQLRSVGFGTSGGLSWRQVASRKRS